MAAQHGVRRFELLDEARGERHVALIVPATRDHLEHQRDVWRPLLRALGEPDAEWDWLADFAEAEEQALEWEVHALTEPAGLLHGLISLRLLPDILYVERLAVAPWNRAGPLPRQRLGCGTRLLIHAMRKSLAKGYGGRIGLHAIEHPGTLNFYRERIRMTEVRMDTIDDMQLRYFELSESRALAHIEGDEP